MVPLPEACIAELEAVLEALDQPLQTRLHLDSFNLTACRQLVSEIQLKLCSQTGLAILDRVPVDRYSLDQNKAIYWPLCKPSVFHERSA